MCSVHVFMCHTEASIQPQVYPYRELVTKTPAGSSPYRF